MTKPKNYDQVPANKPIVDAIKAKNRTQAAHSFGPPTPRCNLAGGPESVRHPAEIAKYLKANSVDTVMGPLTWNEAI